MQKNKIGISITIGWLLLGISFAIWKGNSFLTMKPNEFGDFFAGFLAPLAFLWLVLGYFQQNENIRQNTEVLKAQLDDLRDGMKLRKQKVQPLFNFTVGGMKELIESTGTDEYDYSTRFYLEIKNIGERCIFKNIVFDTPTMEALEVKEIELRTEKSLSLVVNCLMKKGELDLTNPKFRIYYSDILDNYGFQSFSMNRVYYANMAYQIFLDSSDHQQP